MHITDGFLPPTVCIAGYATTAALTWYTLRRINQQEDPQAGVPRAALLTAAFFVASWIHIPIPPGSVHLMLGGLMGVVLGFYAFPAILIGLFFQAVMFGHGGLTTLGINATMIGAPALIAGLLFRQVIKLNPTSRWLHGAAGFGAGALSTGLSISIFFIVLMTNLPTNLDAAIEQAAIVGLTLLHIPLLGIEAIITAMVVLFLQRVRPELLEGTDALPVALPPASIEQA
ncbi:MAG: cobalt transporter CbiM [Chloroflexaceae bacterium]|nr:cobalt transporter CbiM [Chloroflexaceae bacterium]